MNLTVCALIVLALTATAFYYQKTQTEGFLVRDNYKFDDFNYWFRTPPLLYPGGPTPHMPLPINQRLF